MKILHVTQNYYPSFGGTQWLFQNISEYLAAHYNDEVTVFTTDSYFGPHRTLYKKIESPFEIHNKVAIKRFSYYSFYYASIDLFFKFLVRFKLPIPERLVRYRIGPYAPSLFKAMKKGNFDVICASSSHYMYMQYPLLRSKYKNPMPFVFMGALHLKESKADDIMPVKVLQAIKASEFFIANTEFEKQRLLEYGVDENIIKVVGCGIDTNAFDTANPMLLKEKLNIQDKLVIGFFGRQEKSKGIPLLFNAFVQLAHTNKHIVLLLAGSKTPYTQELLNDISLLPQDIAQRCFVINDVDEQIKADVYHAMDIFVSVSQEESFGIVFLEAWLARKPVIGAAIGAVRSVVTHEGDGLLINPGDEKHLVQQLIRLIDNQEEREKMGMNGYSKVMEKYTWPIVVNKYRAIYQEAIEKFKLTHAHRN